MLKSLQGIIFVSGGHFERHQGKTDHLGILGPEDLYHVDVLGFHFALHIPDMNLKKPAIGHIGTENKF